MAPAISGLHHVTAICGPPQPNLDFYVKLLGQRLVKRTVNFDAPDAYHLYYADQRAAPGSILSFFPFIDAGPGRAGPGMASAVAYAVKDLDDEMLRLAEDAVDFDGPFVRFGARGLALNDPDGLRIELLEDANADGGFHSATLWLSAVEATEQVLALMGYGRVGEERTTTGGTGGAERRIRLASTQPSRGSIVDLLVSDAPSIGRPGAGSIDHVAFRVADDAQQIEWRERLQSAGLDVTPVIDRQYFNAVYFRTPGGVLFEIATDPPGFAVDEDPAHLGEALKLPAQYEGRRDRLERVLPELKLPKRPS
ncbi:MAG: ring-cleaving dioxygenase [Pseudomonadota bacterium]